MKKKYTTSYIVSNNKLSRKINLLKKSQRISYYREKGIGILGYALHTDVEHKNAMHNSLRKFLMRTFINLLTKNRKEIL